MVKVSKFYDKKPVLKDIYLSFFYGAKIGVLGLNGSGNPRCCGSSRAPTKSLTARLFFRRVIPSGTWNRNRDSMRTKPSSRQSKKPSKQPSIF